MTRPIDDIYREILRQAEATVDAAVAASSGPAFSSAAETLADEFCRLCIEFGVDWVDFKRCLLEGVEVTEARNAAPRDRSQELAPIVVFALELIPEPPQL